MDDFEPLDFQDKDFVLETLVRFVEAEPEASVTITLQVKGLLVSGVLVGTQRYFKGIENLLKSWEVASASTFAELGRIQFPKPFYLHLEGAKFYPSRNGFPPGEGLFWRGRISEVDGFFLGQVNLETETTFPTLPF